MGDAEIIPLRGRKDGLIVTGVDSAPPDLNFGEIFGVRINGPDIYDDNALTYEGVTLATLRTSFSLTPEKTRELERSLFAARCLHITGQIEDDEELKESLRELFDRTSAIAQSIEDEDLEGLVAEMRTFAFGAPRAALMVWRTDTVLKAIFRSREDDGAGGET